MLRIVADAPANGAAWDGTHTQDWTQGWDTPVLPEPALVMGDMNFGYDSVEYALICGEIDPRRGRIIRVASLRDAWVAAGYSEESGVSVANQASGDARIDHMFVTHSVARHVKSMYISNVARASDHYPVFLELEVPETGFGT